MGVSGKAQEQAFIELLGLTDQGLIRPYQSAYNNLIFPVKKSSGEYRNMQQKQYCWTVLSQGFKNSTPLPYLEKL